MLARSVYCMLCSSPSYCCIMGTWSGRGTVARNVGLFVFVTPMIN